MAFAGTFSNVLMDACVFIAAVIITDTLISLLLAVRQGAASLIVYNMTKTAKLMVAGRFTQNGGLLIGAYYCYNFRIEIQAVHVNHKISFISCSCSTFWTKSD